LKIIFFILFPSILFAYEKINIELLTDKSNIEVNEVFQIDVKIHGVSKDISLENIENINENVMIKYVGEMRGYGYNTIDNKRYDYFVLTFVTKISKPGNYEIGPFVIKIKDKEYKSDLLKIDISDNADHTITNSKYSENNNIETQNSSKEDFYILELSINKTEAFINEPIDIGVNFYNRLGFQNPNYKSLAFPKSTWIERIETNKENSKKIQKNNHVYLLHNIEKEKIFISTSGEYEIESASLDFVGLTTPNFLSVPEHIVLKTKPIKIKINPLPKPEPSDFNGAIGSFDLKVNVNPTKLKTKESATITITLTGDGNFQNINNIGYSIDNSFDIYSSNSIVEKKENINKSKIWEILIIPSKPGKYNLKLDNFCYFDIKQKKYITLEGKKVNLNVLEDEGSKNNRNTMSTITKIGIKDNNDNNNIKLSNNIHYIKIFHGNSNSIAKYRMWFRFVIIFYLIIFVAITIFIFNKFLVFNVIYKNNFNNKNDYKIFSNHINSLKKNINKIIPQNEINSISIILEKYFISKFQIDSIDFTSKSITNKLNKYLSSSKLDELKNIITKLNFIRFGAKEISSEDFLNFLNIIKKFILDIETCKK
jgi:hypothetical protein